MNFIVSNLRNLKFTSKLLYIAPILYFFIGKSALAADPDRPKISIMNLLSGDGILDILLNLISYLLFIISHYIIGNILSWVGTFFDWSINIMTTSNTNIIATGWAVSLNFANMFFIVLLLAIAISTILGLDKFNYKKALPPFLIVVLLINFSMTIGNVVIDFTNVFANYFSSSITTSGTRLSSQVMDAVKITQTKRQSQALVDKDGAIEGVKQDLQKNGESASTMDLVTYALTSEGAAEPLPVDNNMPTAALTIFITWITVIIYQLIAIFILLAGAVYMFSRTLWLWLLLMIAPLAWIAYAFPSGSKIHSQWSKWWETFLGWCFFAPLFLFFTYLAMLISGSSFNSLITNTAILNNHGITAGVIIQLIAVGFLMVAGLFISKKLGVGGSNFVISYAENTGKAASKKFKDMRGKSEWSADNIGKRFGAVGARITAPFGVTERGKRIQERYELERLETRKKTEEQKEKLKDTRTSLKQVGKDKKERLRKLFEEEKQLDEQVRSGGISRESAKELKQVIELEVQDIRRKARDQRLSKLSEIRKIAGEGKSLKDKFKDLAKEEGITEEKKEEKK